MELRRELKEEASTVPLLEQQVPSPLEEESPQAHKTVFSDPTPPTRDVSIQGREGRAIGAPICASLGAMRPLVRKLEMLLLAPPYGCSNSARVKDGMRLLKDDVEKMSSYLDKLSEVEDPPPAANCWMNEARDLSYDMEDYMDSLIFVRPEDASIVPNNIKTSRSRFKFGSRFKFFGHAKTPKTKVDVIAQTLSEFRKYAQEAIERHHMYNLHSCRTLRRRFVSLGPMLPTPMQCQDIVIDGRMIGFINLLANDGDQQLKVLCVLGHACLGKTTLVRVVYNRLRNQYHCGAFIRVSKKPDMQRIFHHMLAQLQCQHSPQDCKEVDLIDNIKKFLQDKRYLIIIDDLRATSVWDTINHAFPKGSQGSRIVTTTQIEDVALTCCSYQSEHVFQMEPLDDDQSRKLFFNRLFGSENDCPEELKEVTNKIVEICDGLPLATISIASLLASHPVISIDLLTYIHQSLSSCFLANSISERMRQVLSLSYNNLPHYLRTCLLYLSMYQQGYAFCKDDLLKQWVAEGLIDTTEGQDIREVAESYLDQLIGRRFIQPICINYNNEVLSCEVHDVVYDLIAHKSAEQNFIMAIDYSCRKDVALYQKARRLSLQLGGVKYAKTPSNISESQVRSLGIFGLLECMPCIGGFKLLRVLNLQLSGHLHGDQDTAIDLTGISQLFHLKYLKIVCNVRIKLPYRLRGLQCLETLDVMGAGKGTVVPWDIIYLPHLLHLSLPVDIDLLDWSDGVESLGKLNHLQELCISTPPSSNHLEKSMEDMDWTIKALERSTQALGSLIEGHGNLKTIQVVAHGSSVRYRGAPKASISWDILAPPPHLQRFECSPHVPIVFYGIPRWMEQLGNLSILKIAVSELLIYDVGILGGFPALTALSLYVEKAPYNKIIFDKAGFSVLKYFKLRFTSGIAWLKFEADAMPNLSKLKLVCNAIPQMDQYEHGIISIEHMPGLREIYVKFGGAAADLECVSRIDVVSNHSSNPIIDFQLVHSGSPGDESTRQKQLDEILEGKPDGYDKALEKPADKRKDGSWYTYTHTFTPHSDGYQWRKCGKEKVNSSAFPRCYYRCNYHRERNCPATKLVQQQQHSHGETTMYLGIYVQEHTCHHAAQAEPEEAAAAGSSAADRLDFSAGLSRQQPDGVSGIVLDRGAKEEFEQQAIACLLQGRRCYSGPGTPEQSLSPDCTGDSAWASAVSLHDHVMDYDVRDTEHAEAIDAFILREVSKDLTLGLLQGRRCYSGASTPEESSSPIFTGDDDASASTVSDTASWHAVATDAFIPRQESQDFTVCGPAPAAIATRRASHDGVPRNAPYFREARSSAVEDAEENSMFETSHVLGALLASSPLLARAWDRCVATGAVATGFVHDDGGRDGGMVYVAFSGLQAALSVAGPAVASGADVFAPVGLGGHAAGARAFPQLAAAEPDAAAAGERVAVQALALRCFLKLCGSPEFQMLLNQIRGKAVVFTGHSLGGAIAALAALHYLCISSLSSPCGPSPPVLCVTFGSPLVGNEALSRAILRERWGGNFCNVVSQHDVIPRLLFCPLDAVPVRVIVGMQLQQWPGHTHNTVVVDAEKEGLRQLIQGHVCTVAMEQKLVVADPESRGGSPYRPFGAYVMCSPEGAVCVDNSTAAVRMLYATFAARGEGDTDTTSLDLEAAHSCYGHLVLKMPQNLLLKRRPHAMDVLASMSNSNYDAGISLAMEASGIGSEAVEATTTRYWLKASKREGRSPSLNCAVLATRLGRITPCRAQLEWYKASFDGNTGYYDAFKQRRSPKKFNKADMCRIKLGQFWDGVLTMLDYSQLPHDFHRRAKWVNAARFYQLLVEPLDIADYHRKNLHKIRGSYITHGRARRYELFDKWWKEKAAFTGTSTGDASVTATARSKYAGLTQDPCFWARVEEAWDRTESAQAEHDVAMLAMKLGRLREFERYARELVESKEVSIDVVAPQSSYTRWVEEWKKLLLGDEPRTASQF